MDAPTHPGDGLSGNTRSRTTDRLARIRNGASMTVYEVEMVFDDTGTAVALRHHGRVSEQDFGSHVIERLGISHLLPDDEIGREEWFVAGYEAAFIVNASGGNHSTDLDAVRAEFYRLTSTKVYKQAFAATLTTRAKAAETTADKYPERALTPEQLYAVCFFAKGIGRAERIGLWDAAHSPNALIGTTPRERNADRKRRERGRKALQHTPQETIMEAVAIYRQHYEQGQRIERLLLDLRDLLRRDVTADELTAYLQGFADARGLDTRDPRFEYVSADPLRDGPDSECRF